MGFIKVGDEMPIGGYVDANGEEQLCPHCKLPMTVVAFADTNDVELVCECSTPELITEVEWNNE